MVLISVGDVCWSARPPSLGSMPDSFESYAYWRVRFSYFRRRKGILFVRCVSGFAWFRRPPLLGWDWMTFSDWKAWLDVSRRVVLAARMGVR